MLKMTLSKWGNSLAVIVPKKICELMGWKSGQLLIIDIDVKEKQIIFKEG